MVNVTPYIVFSLNQLDWLKLTGLLSVSWHDPNLIVLLGVTCKHKVLLVLSDTNLDIVSVLGIFKDDS